MRSRNVSPGFAVIRTTSQSDSTRVPPVTLLRSPPLSRITGALSPVIALSSTDATPSMTSPSLGIKSPASTSTTSSLRRAAAGTGWCAAPYSRSVELLGRARRVASLASESAWALPRPSAIASAKLANSTVNHSQAETPRMNPGDSVPAIQNGLDAQAGREDAADEHGEHHRVAELPARIELPKRIDHRPPHDRRIEQRSSVCGRSLCMPWVK